MSKGKSEKWLVTKLFDWDKESVSSEDEGVTKVKAFMAITKDEPSVGKDDARSDVVKKTLNKIKAKLSQGSSSRKAHMVPKPFIDCKYCGFNNHHSNECEYYPGCDICGSIAHETTDCDKKASSNNRKPRIANRQSIEPTEKWPVRKGSTIEHHSKPRDLFPSASAYISFIWICLDLLNPKPSAQQIYPSHSSKNYAPLPQKETVRATLANMGLVDENDPQLSSTDLHHKAPTDKKSRKKKISSSSKPKTFNVIRKYPSKKQVIETQHVEELVATTDTTKSIVASESAVVPGNQPKPVDAKKADDDGEDHSEHKVELSKTDEAAADDLINELRVADKIDDLVPKMVADALEERLLELLSDTLKNILPDLLKDSVKQALPKFDKKVKKTLRVKVPDIILKPLYKDFNALNRMESQQFVHLQKQQSKAIHSIVGKSIKRNGEQQPNESTTEPMTTKKVSINAQGEQMLSALVMHSADEPPVKKLKVVLDDIYIPSPTPVNSIRPTIIDNILYEQFAENLFSSGGSVLKLPNLQQFSPSREGQMTLKDAKTQMKEIKRLAELKAKKEKSEKRIQKVLSPDDLQAQAEELAAYEAKRAKMLEGYNHIKRLAELKAKKEKSEKRIQKVLSPDDLQAQAEELAAYEAKRAKTLEGYNHCISFRAYSLPTTKINYRINNSTK
nr:hypothetical protein [Tanacetum cinerariifolium]